VPTQAQLTEIHKRLADAITEAAKCVNDYREQSGDDSNSRAMSHQIDALVATRDLLELLRKEAK
jgi:hypothetical protein